MPSTASKTLSEALQVHAEEYLIETGSDEFTTSELAAWALQTGRYEPPRNLVMRKCREDYSRAMREQYISNSENQPVRVRHVRRVTSGATQKYIWSDIRTAPREKMEASFKQRREQIVGECRQLDRDRRYWNELNQHEAPIQLVFDFTDDVEEGRFTGEYPPRQPR